MALNLVKLSTSFLLLFFGNPFPIAESRITESPEHPFTKTLQNLEGVHKGQTVKGVSDLKNYLQKFGYLIIRNDQYSKTAFSDHFDENLESALKDFQKYHHLDTTGRIDTPTIDTMSLPRCGVPDIIPRRNKRNGLVIVANYTFFPGSPKWDDSKRALTYTFKSSADVLSMDVVRQACESAFKSWSQVTDFTFTETNGDSADVVIGFHRGDHGDGYPFDGPGMVLAHTSTTQIDLETVALHEMGHLIGLGHSSNPDSVMYPTYGGVRRNLKQDDIDGIRALYGYN
ncbi:PGBD-like superfamily [Sesbania bispinosa]|nr:PGBD-like superfamily [Sesbania bispinosa]